MDCFRLHSPGGCRVQVSVARSRAGSQAYPATFGSVNADSFVPGGYAVVARTAIRTIGIADIAIFFGDRGVRAAKKRLPHFLEAGAAVFAVKQIKDGGHDRPPSFDRGTLSCLSGAKR